MVSWPDTNDVEAVADVARFDPTVPAGAVVALAGALALAGILALAGVAAQSRAFSAATNTVTARQVIKGYRNVPETDRWNRYGRDFILIL